MKLLACHLVEGADVLMELCTQLLQPGCWQLFQLTSSLQAAQEWRAVQSIQLLT